MRSGLLSLCFTMVFGVSTAPSKGLTSIHTEDTALAAEARDTGVRVALLTAHSAMPAGRVVDGYSDYVETRFIDHVRIASKDVPVRWRTMPAQPPNASERARSLRFASDNPPLELISIWEAAQGPGPIEHHVRIVNRGARTVLIPRQTSLALSMPLRDGATECWWVEKGGGTPTPVGVHRQLIGPGFSIQLKSGPLAATEPRDPIPFVAIRDTQTNEGWYAGIEFSGRVMMQLKTRQAAGGQKIDADFGLEPKHDLYSRVEPDDVYDTPTAFVGCFKGDMDDCGNRFRKWVASHLRPPVRDERYPLLVNNSWGSGMAVDEKLARAMIDQSAELGLEMFHIDAGWFRAVGDWRPNPTKFPGGLGPISDYAHKKGLKFGLWVGWTQVGNSAGFREDRARVVSTEDASRRDWLSESLTNGWKPGDFWGETLCLADADAERWCLDLLRSLVKENRLDMLEHDQRMIVDNCPKTDHAHTSSRVDTAFRSGEAYYRIYDALRKENPDLLFEDCVNGGQMVDFGVIRRVHYISITDTYDPLSNRRAFYDASYVIPPAMCECYIAQHPGKTDANFLYMLRSGMMGWCTIMLDTTQWTPKQHDLAKRMFETYKTKLRPLINRADLYHISDRPDGIRWDGMEYFDPKAQAGVLFAFRGKTDEPRHVFHLRGLDPDATYELSCEGRSAPPVVVRGAELSANGLTVRLDEPESSELVYLRRK